ncbi:MAG: hypothetical protein IT423_14940, partial [Pirellulaceae bacterium]|nr:hypothetical protein [Pirellulaceae bacterium]
MIAWLVCLNLAAVAVADLKGLGALSTAENSGQSATGTQPTAESGMQVTLGLGGVWKIGHPTPVRIDLPPQWGTRPKTIEVTTVDGDGVAVTYRQPIHWPASDAAAAPLQDATTRSRWCMITIGRA